MKKLAVVLIALGVAACDTPAPDTAMMGDPLKDALAGKTLMNVDNPDTLLTFGADGSLSGAVTGTWSVENGQFCRTLTEPASVAGSLCQDVVIDGDVLTFLAGTNGDSSWTPVAG
ncbi:hypothetical protein [Dinoroseobacter sp. S76]|uniref:hypothetical protein n=1 Tax=Dinoroseobacter sp. S76 TaxID=3415124 RepID=UPI003C7DF5E5